MSAGPIISDLALLRFLERAGGLDVETIRTMLSNSLQRAAEAAARLGSGDYTIKADGLVYIVVNGRVVTTIDDTGRPILPRARGDARA